MNRHRIEDAAGTAWFDPADPRLLILAATVVVAAAAFLLVQAQGAGMRAHLVAAGFGQWPGQPVWTRIEAGRSLAVAHLDPVSMRARMAALGLLFSGGLLALMIHGDVEGWARRSWRIKVFFGLLIGVGLLLGLGSLVPVGPAGFTLDLGRGALVESVAPSPGSAAIPLARLRTLAIGTRRTGHVVHYRLVARTRAGRRVPILEATGRAEAARVRALARRFLRKSGRAI